MDLKDIVREDVDWNNLAQETVQWQAIFNTGNDSPRFLK
jgi:hypothetical protein